ncbi:hypothetical protein Cgig2_021669 [Carnegiea gigantea]|uniref:Uncharacterized protein n=1 Tax=Carnegiea gigantea TaxID=171969 RepID=A0A9Q1QR23_9CARY|nr:hypothetical protein Cgig2_021669 [Carnegiea gigantea]
MTGTPVNFAHYILKTMSKAGSILRPTPLPCVNLFTLRFNHFSVCLTYEIKETKPVPIITLASLKNIQFFQTESGDWKFIEDMTQEELVCVSKKFGQYVKPHLSSPQSIPPSSFLDHVLNLNEVSMIFRRRLTNWSIFWFSTLIVNTKTLELIYLLMTGTPVNFAHYILRTMSKVRSILRPAPLPCVNLFTLGFNHFSVCLTHEIKETKLVPIITLASLKNIQFFQTESGDWKFVEDMTQEELVCVSKKFGQYVKPHLTSPQSIPPSSLLDHILNLNEVSMIFRR